MAEDAPDRHDQTEAPTHKRREDERKKGNVLRSAELQGAVLLLLGALTIGKLGPDGWRRAKSLVRRALDPATLQHGIESPELLIRTYLVEAVIILAPLLAVLVVGALVTTVPFGVAWKPERLAPDLSRIRPKGRIRDAFGLKGLTRLASTLLKGAVVTWVAWSTIESEAPAVLTSLRLEVQSSFVAVAPLAFDVLLRCAVALFILSNADLGLALFFRERDMKMTKQEVKDEAKETNGNPEIKGRIRKLQREQARRRMMDEVPKATVVITNPTHVSVAVRYDKDKMVAPVVVAKGYDLIALRIREVATAHGVPLVEDVPTARALYRACDPGQPIPPDLYQAVAKIIAHVMRLERKRRS